MRAVSSGATASPGELAVSGSTGIACGQDLLPVSRDVTLAPEKSALSGSSGDLPSGRAGQQGCVWTVPNDVAVVFEGVDCLGSSRDSLLARLVTRGHRPPAPTQLVF